MDTVVHNRIGYAIGSVSLTISKNIKRGVHPYWRSEVA